MIVCKTEYLESALMGSASLADGAVLVPPSVVRERQSEESTV